MLDKLVQLEIIITTSKPLISENFVLKKNTKVQMSWGIVPAYIHYRIVLPTKLYTSLPSHSASVMY